MVKENRIVPLKMIGIVAILLIVTMTTALAENVDGCYDGVSGAVSRWKLDEAAGGLEDVCGLFAATGAGLTYTYPAPQNFSIQNAATVGMSTGETATYNNAEFTAVAWVNYNATTNARGMWDAWAPNNGWMMHRNTNSSLRGYVMSCAAYSVAVDNNAWNMVTLVYSDTNNYIKVYTNGSISENNTCAVGYVSGGHPLFLTGDGASTLLWNGRLDNMRYYNSTLTDTEIFNLYTYDSLTAAGGLIIDFTPTGAPIDEATTYTGSVVGNVSDATGWWWDFSFGGTSYFTDSGVDAITTTQTLNVTGNWSVTLIGEFAAANYTVTQNVTVTERPDANFTVETATPWFVGDTIQFNDTTTDTGGFTIADWWWDFDDGNSSTDENATNTFIEPGEYEVCLISQNEFGVNSTEYCENITINGFLVNVYDQKTYTDIVNWTMTVSNSTYSRSFSNQTNPFTWSNLTDFPTGPITISISAIGYVGRNYYRTYNLGSYVNLNAILLSNTDGIYSYFITQDAFGSVISDVTLVFQIFNVTQWITVGEAQTDDTGSATMWLDWTITTRLTASKTGYTPVTKSFTPQPITYTLIMGSASVFEFASLNDSMWTARNPTNTDVELTDNITMAVFDPESGISICGLNLTFTDGTVFNSTNTTTEQMFCTATIQLTGSGIGAATKFYAVPWFTANSTGAYDWSRLYNIDGSTSGSLPDAISSLESAFGPEALLMTAIFLTLLSGAGIAFYVGSGTTLVMMGVSGIFYYYGWFGAYSPLWFIAVIAGLAGLYIERRQY